MLETAIVSGVIFLLAIVMTMTGRGGGNFYVLIQVIAGLTMQQAAGTGQAILFSTSIAAIIVFQKHKTIVWPMAFFIGLTTSLMAFVGGLTAYAFESMTLKFAFSGMLVLAALFMLLPVKKRGKLSSKQPGYWKFKTGGEEYMINLFLAVPIALATGFVAGMLGISGGSFLVPLMVLACRLPMRLAVGTASVMVGATAMMGFLGHVSQAGFDPAWALPQAGAAVIGGIIGGKLALKTKPKKLKLLFALTTFAAAVFMVINAICNAC